MARFDRIEDAVQKVNGTLVRYEDEPVYITQQAGWNFRLYELESNKVLKDIDVNDEKLDISSPRLGYVNYADGSVKHIGRVPVRRSLQGLSTNNTYEFRFSNETGMRIQTLHSRFLFNLRVKDTIKEIYPSHEEAISRIKSKKDNVQAIAVHRKILLAKNELGILQYHYFGMPVAFRVPDRNENSVLVPVRYAMYGDLLKQDIPELEIDIYD